MSSQQSRRWTRRGWPPALAAITCLAAWGNVLAADDVVIVKSRTGRTLRRTGRIADYNGRRLVLELSNGRREQIPVAKLARIQTVRHPAQQKAATLLEQRKYSDALENLRVAQKEELRAWMRREIIAGWVRCYEGLDRIDLAGDTFLLSLLASEQQTRHFAVIPLAWQPRPGLANISQKAEGWLNSQVPAAQLLGASWLLTGPRRQAAIATLRRLSSNEDPRIGFLAEAQLWRTRSLTADGAEAGRWEQRIGEMPSDLRAGPYYLLGQAYERLGRAEEAALAYLRVPVLYAQHGPLADASLLAAARQLEQLKQTPQARSLYQKLIRQAPLTLIGSEARQRLDNLNQSRTEPNAR